MIQFGICQGRLEKSETGELQSFPYATWQNEFYNAKKLNINYIELLTEKTYNQKNPIWSKNGCRLIKQLLSSNNLISYSLCDNYILTHSLTEKSTFEYLKILFYQASLINLKMIVLPLLEKTALNKKNINTFVYFFKDLLKEIEIYNIKISFEIVTNFDLLIHFFQLLDHPLCKFTYDTGNFHNINLFSFKEFMILSEHLNHVHIKDKDLQQYNVPLGNGTINFKNYLSIFKKINYQGNFTLETPRKNSPLNSAKNNLNFLKENMRFINYGF